MYFTLDRYDQTVYSKFRSLAESEFNALRNSFVRCGYSDDKAQAEAEQGLHNMLDRFLVRSAEFFRCKVLEENGEWQAFIATDNGNLSDCHVIYCMYERNEGYAAKIIAAYIDELKHEGDVQVFCQPLKTDAETIATLSGLGFCEFEFPDDWLILPLDRDPFSIVMRYYSPQRDET